MIGSNELALFGTTQAILVKVEVGAVTGTVICLSISKPV